MSAMIRFKEIPVTQIGVFNVELEQKVHLLSLSMLRAEVKLTLGLSCRNGLCA